MFRSFQPHRALLFIIIIMIGFPSCFSPREKPGAPVVIAFVNGMAIKEDTLRYRLFLERSKYGDETFKDTKRFREIKKELLDRIIQNRIIIEWGEKQGIVLTEDEKAEGLNQLKKGYAQSEFERMLEEKNIPYVQWQAVAEENLAAQKVIGLTLATTIRVSSHDIQKYYNEHRDDYRIEEQFHVRHIVTDSLEKAQKIHEQLLRGENFAKMAIMHSLSPDRAQGGDLGFFKKGTHPKEFDKACEPLKPGDISPVVQSPYGFHIFKMLEKIPPRTVPLAEAEPTIRGVLAQKKLDESFPAWLEKIRGQSQIQIMDKELKKMEL